MLYLPGQLLEDSFATRLPRTRVVIVIAESIHCVGGLSSSLWGGLALRARMELVLTAGELPFVASVLHQRRAHKLVDVVESFGIGAVAIGVPLIGLSHDRREYYIRW